MPGSPAVFAGPGRRRTIASPSGAPVLEASPWGRIRPLIDLCVYLELDEEVRVGRLIARHVAHGRTRDEAERFVEASDQVNARLIGATRSLADLVVNLGV
jgi:pantothenate kinase